MQKEKKLENEEKKLLSVVDGKKIDDFEISQYNTLGQAMSRLSTINRFKEMISSKIELPMVYKKQAIDFFEVVALLLSGGFDYYFVSEEKKVIDSSKSLEEQPTHFDILISEEQIDKLRTTVQSFKKLDFISYLDNNQERCAIWLENSPLYMNVVPFIRDKENQVGIRDKKNGFISLFSKDELDSILVTSIQEHNGIEYKSLSLNKNN